MKAPSLTRSIKSRSLKAHGPDRHETRAGRRLLADYVAGASGAELAEMEAILRRHDDVEDIAALRTIVQLARNAA